MPQASCSDCPLRCRGFPQRQGKSPTLSHVIGVAHVPHKLSIACKHMSWILFISVPNFLTLQSIMGKPSKQKSNQKNHNTPTAFSQFFFDGFPLIVKKMNWHWLVLWSIFQSKCDAKAVEKMQYFQMQKEIHKSGSVGGCPPSSSLWNGNA